MYNMQKLPAQSDTNRIPYSRSPYAIAQESPKNYRSLILKILSVVVVLIILIALAVILIKLFVLDSSKKECSDGFFHPEDEEGKSSCYPCKLSNCKNCKGKIRSNTCTECLDNYTPEYDTSNEIVKCSLLTPGTNSLSKTEDNIKCNPGYYLPNDSSDNICEKCSLDNCEKCQGDKNKDECILCKDNYIPKYDENNLIKSCNEKCNTNNKCKECDLNNNECIKCDKGYFIPSDDEVKLECIKCSLEHCQSCQGKKNYDECGLCEDGYEGEYDNNTNIIKTCKLIDEIENNNNCEIGEGDKCLSCNLYEKNKCASCNPSYKLIEGKCVLDEVKATQKIEPTEKIEEVKPTEKIQEVKPTEKIEQTEKIEKPTQKVEPTQKTQEVKPTQKVETTQKVEPTQKVEQTQKVEPTQKTQEVKPTQKIEPTQKPSQKTEPIVEGDDDPDDPTDDFISLTAKYNSAGKNKLTPIIYTGKNQYIKQMRVDGDLKPSNDIRVETSGNYLFEEDSLNEHTIKMWLEIKEDILNNLFKKISYLKSVTFNKIKNSKNIAINTMSYTFSNCQSLEHVNLSNFNTESIENMECLFYNNYKLTSLDLSKFNTKKVKVMGWLFYGCSSLKYLDLSSFDTSQVTEMMSMFCQCHSLTSINFGNNFITSKVVNMSFMFSNNSLTELDLRGFDTKNVKNMQYMFYKCSKLESLDISSFDTSQVTKMENMFSYCSSLTALDLHNFDFTTLDKYYTSPPIMHYCKSLKFIDISTYTNLMFRDFFTGVPTSGGYIRASRTLVNNLLSMGIRILLDWDWEIVG